jgi:serine/threonine protein kinase
MLHEALTGRPPYTDGGVVAVLMSHVNDPAPDPRATDPRVPAPLADLCLSLMRKNPDDRPASAAAVAAQLATMA